MLNMKFKRSSRGMLATAALAAFLIWFFLLSPAKTEDVGMSSRAYLSMINIRLLQHCEDTGGYLPALGGMKDLASLEYKAKPTDPLFIDPTSNKPFHTNPYYSGAKLSSIERPNLTALVYDSGKAPDGLRAVVLATLYVRRVNPDEWEVIKRQSHIDQP